MHKTRHWFAPQSLLEKTRKTFNTFLYDDGKNVDIPTIDCFMSGLAVFHLKYPALLQFEYARLDEPRTREILKRCMESSALLVTLNFANVLT